MTQLNLGTDAIAAARTTKSWLLYPVGYNETYGPIFDKYEVHGTTDQILNTTAHIIFYSGIVFAFLSAILLSWFLGEKEE